jgi:rhodanese-related sulfurtransferase
MKNYYSLFFLVLFIFLMPLHSIAEEMGEGPVWITAEIPSIEINHNDQKIVIERVQNNENMIDWDYALTSRPCPPFCIQPMKLAKGVETIGELEMLDYIKQLSDGEKVLIVDSRDVWWTENGMIPGAVNIPWTHLHSKHATIEEIIKILEFDFGAIYQDGLLSFEHVKTLVFYCNGNWCGQSPTNIRSLLALGYPADKIKWYRGGMQAWKALGLTTVKPGK